MAYPSGLVDDTATTTRPGSVMQRYCSRVYICVGGACNNQVQLTPTVLCVLCVGGAYDAKVRPTPPCALCVCVEPVTTRYGSTHSTHSFALFFLTAQRRPAWSDRTRLETVVSYTLHTRQIGLLIDRYDKKKLEYADQKRV